MTATATIIRPTTHGIVSPLVSFEVLNVDSPATRMGRIVDGRDKRWTATEVREYTTYGLWQNGTARRFALVNGSYVELCGRCGGSGNYPSTEWNGVCYACSGTGQSDKWFTTVDELTARMITWGRGVRTTSNKAQAKFEARQAEIAAWREAHNDLVTWVDALIPTETIEIDGWHYGHEAGTVLTQECFTQFGTTAAPMIDSVRDGGDLDRRATAYLTKVMASAIERATSNTTRFAGEVKGKVTVTGTVTQVKEIEGDYGFSTLIVVSGIGDFEGVTVKTFTTSRATLDLGLTEGDIVTVVATVKEHETYREVRQTMVTRAKFTRI